MRQSDIDFCRDALPRGAAEDVAVWLGDPTDPPPDIAFRRAALADATGLRFLFRAPFWLLQPQCAERAYARATSALMLELARLGIPFSVDRQTGAVSSLVSQPDPRTIVVQFHTHGSGTGVWHVKDSHLFNHFYFNSTGYSGWLKISSEQRAFIEADDGGDEAEIEAMAANYIAANTSIIPQKPLTGLTPRPGRVFFPLQITHDTVMAHFYMPMLKALVVAARVTGEVGGSLMVKRHPECRCTEVEEVLADLAKLPHVELFDGSIHDAIAASDLVLVGNSSVGFAALMHFKPLLVFAASDYAICAHVARDAADLERALRFVERRVDRPRIARFLRVFSQELTFNIQSPPAARRVLLSAIKEALPLLVS